jgi:type I restriction enzyme M protein
MLDTDTKRRIDNCRDILVGKVPDPKSQVEQITIALIYKFMDDMDAEAEELGGKRKFFFGTYEKYGWSKLMASNMGGVDILMLYSEAIQKMNENPGIPPLFRDIFKNAYLPYRDPETLRSFLKEINTFSYDHSEKLGDAFEYLLSVLGSQGDAGQFRTPRHIIEFIVDIIDPKKNETILDPACGTAGFLISAYKHILDANKKERLGDKLTPDERKRLAVNIHGYDISPDMVRLSLVNLYLHGFANPRIEEYDTLTSEEKWNEYADIILANPPFMSPKGGIKPHKRFSVQASRSEVLFVDYISEHLTPTGRAGIIVPEGIIFQGGTAYKQLREMLVKNSLIAVISLPSGVFNPYSGVKTSILILDKRLAKKSDSILFAKIENDGFGLGAQRRAIEKNDLTETITIINDWINHEKLEMPERKNILVVPKEKLAANGDYNLTGERYREGTSQNHIFTLVELGDICELYQPKTITQSDFVENGPYLVFGANGVIGCYDQYNHEESEVLVTCRGATCGTVNKSEPKSWITGNAMVVGPKDSRLSKDFLYFLLKGSDLSRTISGAAQPQITRQGLAPFQIPLPPLEIQKEIVAEIKGYQKIIDGARTVLDNYRPHIPIHPDWPMVKLGEVCRYSGGTQPPKDTFISEPRDGYIRLLQIRDYKSDTNAVYIPKREKHKTCEPEDVMIGRYGPPVFQILKGKSGAYNVALIKCLPDLSRLDRMWLFHFFSSPRIQESVIALSVRVRQSGVRPDDLDELSIPLPPLVIQKAIVAEIEAEQELVAANRELIARFERKIQITIGRIWGEEDSLSKEI